MKRLISSILIFLTVLTMFAPLSAVAASSCSSITNLTQYSSCCDGSSTDSLACKNYALQSGGAGTTTANSCTNVSSLAQYSSCCSGTATDTASCKTFAAAQQSNAATLQQYNPNISIGQGNTYGGSSGSVAISGIGGAIASCANVGGLITSAVTNLLSSTSITKKLTNPSSFIGGSAPVSTSDTKTQAALADQNKTTDCLDGIAYAVAKNSLAQITTKTLNWVNTGLNGNPLYVQNVSSYLGSIQNQQTSLFLSTLQGSDPIFGNALRASITFSTTGNASALVSLNTPLNTPQAQAYNSFQTDFTNGGWDALLNPAYNPIGSLFNASDTLANNITTQQTQAQNEIQRNNGFLDMKHCTQYANNGNVATVSTSALCSSINSDSTYETCCTGQSADDSAACQSYATADATAAGSPECANITSDTVYDQCCSTDSGDSPMCVAYNDSTEADATKIDSTTNTITDVSTNNGAGFSNQPVCTQWSTTTPGSIIASQVQSVTNSPVQQLTYANKINEVLGSFFDSFVNNLLSKGLQGSGTITPSSDGGYGSEGDNYLANSSLSGSTSDLGYQASDTGDVDTGDFDISRPQQLRAILQTQEDFLSRTYDAQIALERIVPAIGALDYCIPGPNPDFQTGLDSNWQTFLSSIQQAPANSPSTLDSILGALPVVGGIISVFTDSNKAPSLWTADSVLADKATGGNIAIDRTFYDPSTAITTSTLETGLQAAYEGVVNQLNYYDIPGNTFKGSNVGTAFEQQVAPGDLTDLAYVDGFLQDAYTDTDSLVGYNEAATTIDQQYNQNISDTQNTIEQMTDILNQVDQIVGTAKAAYIAANPSVNLTCLNNAYVVDTSAIVPVARVEPDPQYKEEDAMVQHSINAANAFYSGQAI